MQEFVATLLAEVVRDVRVPATKGRQQKET